VRGVTGLYAILLLVWSSMMLGLCVVFGVILAARVPFDETTPPGLVGAFRVILGAALGILWLYSWKRLTDAYFRRVIRSRPKEGEVT